MKNTNPNTILIMFPQIKCNKILLEQLNKNNICVSVGSACKTNDNKPSHVLDTMNIRNEDKKKVIRISLSDLTTLQECKFMVETLIKLIK